MLRPRIATLCQLWAQLVRRLASIVPEPALGVFLTPAIVDHRTQGMLDLPSRRDEMIYLFAFGWPGRRRLHFAPFRCPWPG